MDSKEETKLTKKMQQKELIMLKKLIDVFESNNIKYFLACGTTLGCVRHNGFIPWDDDVDIYILGKDLPKIKKIFIESDTGMLELHDFDLCEGYPYSFPKIVSKDTLLIEKDLKHLNYKCGVYIDLFPLVEVSDNIWMRKIQENKRYFYYCLLKAYFFKFDTPFRKGLSWLVRKLFNPKKLQENLYRQYTRIGGEKFLIDAGTFGRQALLSKEIFKEGIKMVFENNNFQIPKYYDQYLKHYYGDYMTLPKEKDRISNHHFFKIEFFK